MRIDCRNLSVLQLKALWDIHKHSLTPPAEGIRDVCFVEWWELRVVNTGQVIPTHYNNWSIHGLAGVGTNTFNSLKERNLVGCVKSTRTCSSRIATEGYHKGEIFHTVTDRYEIVVNPKVVEWFSLDATIAGLLDSPEESNHKLAHTLVKGALQSFKEFDADVDDSKIPQWIKDRIAVLEENEAKIAPTYQLVLAGFSNLL